jgi:hypothetical protein
MGIPGCESVVTVPEKDNDEHYDGKKVCCLEEFVAHASIVY